MSHGFMNDGPASPNSDGKSLGDFHTLLPQDSIRPREVLALGAVIDERYEVLALLGRGGMGEVYACRDRKLARDVAVKRLLSGRDVTPVALQRFRREANAIAQLSHPNIVTLFEFGDDAGGPYFAMERLAGSDLHAYVKEHGALRPSEVLRIGREICKALAYAHSRGLVHRDLKPSNLFRLPDGSIKVLDFGLVQDQEGSGMSQVGIGMGTADYAAPEQREDASKADVRSDIYSLAATLYFLATARTPRVISERHLAEGLRGLVLPMLDDDPRHRPQSIADVVAAIQAAERTGDAPAPVVTAAPGAAHTLACPSCKHVNPRTSLYCGECRKELHMRCLNASCREPDITGSRYCGKCGNDLQPQRKYFDDLRRASEACTERRWSDAKRLLSGAIVLGISDPEAKRMLAMVDSTMANIQPHITAAKQAHAREQTLLLDKAIRALEALVAPEDAALVECKQLQSQLEIALAKRAEQRARLLVEAEQAHSRRAWAECRRLLERAQALQLDPAMQRRVELLRKTEERISELEREVPAAAQRLDLESLEAGIREYGTLVPEDSPAYNDWLHTLLPSTRADLDQRHREYDQAVAEATDSEHLRDWRRALGAWHTAQNTGLSAEMCTRGIARTQGNLERVAAASRDAEQAYAECDLSALEGHAQTLQQLSPEEDPQRVHVVSNYVLPARQRSADAIAQAAEAEKLLAAGEWERALETAQQSLNTWSSLASARGIRDTAELRLGEWRTALARADQAIRTRSIAESESAIRACRELRRQLRPEHPKIRELQTALALRKSKRKRLALATLAAFVVVDLAWVWFAGLQYSSQLAAREQQAIQSADQAADAVKGLRLVQAGELLDQVDQLIFDESTALQRVKELHAASAVAWVPQPEFLAELGLVGLQRPELMAQVQDLRADWTAKRDTYRAAQDQVHEALVLERFADAAQTADGLATFGKDDPANEQLPILVSKLRSISTELSEQNGEVRRRLGRADLVGAQLALKNYADLQRIWNEAKPLAYRGAKPWERPEASQAAAVQAAQAQYDSAVEAFAAAAKQYEKRDMVRAMEDLKRVQATDSRLVEWVGLVGGVEAAEKSASLACDEIRTSMSSRAIESAIKLYDGLEEGPKTLFHRNCAVERVFTKSRAEYKKALGEFDAAMEVGNLSKARQSLSAAQLLQRTGGDVETRRRRLEPAESNAKNDSDALVRILDLADAQDLAAAQMAWDGLKAAQRQSTAARELESNLKARWRQLDELEQRLDAAVRSFDESGAEDALRAMAMIQAQGPRVATARGKAERAFAEHRQSVAAALAQLEVALQAKSVAQADVALAMLKRHLERTPDGLQSDQWSKSQASVARLRKELDLDQGVARAREVLSQSAPSLEDLESAEQQLESVDKSNQLLTELRGKIGNIRISKWADVLARTPDSSIIKDKSLRDQIAATGLPWRVKHRETGIEMVLIPPGKYKRGASSGDPEAGENEYPAHTVTISQSFYMGVYEVTQAEWMKVMGSNPSHFKDEDLPVEQVSWTNIQVFLRKSPGLRLPTEGEWEYACRAGTKGSRYGNLDAIAWYYDGNDSGTHTGGRRMANGFGLHDMLGNVYEWCADWLENYSPSSQTDPTGPSSGEYRVCKGGSWNDRAGHCRASTRSMLRPADRDPTYGFRVARTP